MCGRARCTLTPGQVARAFGFPTSAGGGDGGAAVPTRQMDRFQPSYNVSPGAYLPVGAVRVPPAGGSGEVDGAAAAEGPVIQCMKWGLVPSFTKKTEKPNHFRMFNARSESIKERASFRRLIPKNRCLVAVEGFYEWKKDGSKKQPYYIYFQDQRPLVFAALFDSWMNSEGDILYTFSILTTRASASLEWLHDRMPVILANKISIDAWLNHAFVKVEELTVPYERADLVWHPVTTAIGKTSFDGPECIKEVQLSTPEKSISQFFTKKFVGHDQSEKPQKASKETAELDALQSAKHECTESEDQAEQANQQHPAEKQDASSRVPKAESVAKYEDMIFPDNTIGKQDTSGMKRQFADTEANSEVKMEHTDSLAFGPVRKKEKGPKFAWDGQASLLSYFTRK